MEITIHDLLASQEKQLALARAYGVLPPSLKRKRSLKKTSRQSRTALKRAVEKFLCKYPVYKKTKVDIPRKGKRYKTLHFSYADSFWAGTQQKVVAQEQTDSVRAYERFCGQIEASATDGDFIRLSMIEPTLAWRRGDMGVGFRFSAGYTRQFVLNWLLDRGLYVNSRGQIKITPQEKTEENGATNPCILEQIKKEGVVLFIFATKITITDDFGTPKPPKKRGRPRKAR